MHAGKPAQSLEHGGTGHFDVIAYVGLDLNKATISVAVADGRRGGEVRHVDVFANFADHIAKLVERVASQSEDLLPTWSMRSVVEAVRAMRGVILIVAVTVVAEVGDFSRFQNPRQLMAYFGQVPSEQSCGASARRGGVTKAGNKLARRVLTEEAWTELAPEF